MHNQKNYSEVHPLLARLEGVRAASGGLRWMAFCPAHDDRTQSLSLRLNGNNKMLVHCFAGCTAAQVVAAVGLTMRDLFPVSECGWRTRPTRPSFDTDLETIVLMMARSARERGEPLSQEDEARVRRARKLLLRGRGES